MAVTITAGSVLPTSVVEIPSSVTPIRAPSILSSAAVGTPVVLTTGSTSYMPTEFFIFRGYEGPQLIITWVPPTNVLTEDYRLVRREFDFPTNPDDGIIVFTTEDGSPFLSNTHTELPVTFYEEKGITGKGIVENKVYFYRFFAKVRSTGEWVTDDSSLGRGMGIKTGYFANKLWDSLPDLYHIQDGAI